jgi:hypothetical protein
MSPLCRECKYHRPDRFFRFSACIPVFGWLSAPWLLREARRFAKCGHPKARSPDEANPALGTVEKQPPMYCMTFRKDFGALDHCGPEAKYFER